MNNNQRFKIIFSDIDGTLLNNDRELSKVTIQEVKRITQENQIQFILVSARMPSGIKYLQDQLNNSSPIVCYNGALILAPSVTNGFEVIDSKSIDYKVVLWFINKSKEYSLHCSIYSNDSWVTENRDKWTIREENNTKVNSTISSLIETLSIWETSKLPLHKVMIMGNSDLIDVVEKEANLLYSSFVNIYRSKDTYLEITPKSVSKASACSRLLDILKLSSNDAIAFGDNYNDIEMISMVNLGIAMGNAIDEVKNASNLVVPSNISDGVAITLKELFP